MISLSNFLIALTLIHAVFGKWIGNFTSFDPKQTSVRNAAQVAPIPINANQVIEFQTGDLPFFMDPGTIKDTFSLQIDNNQTKLKIEKQVLLIDITGLRHLFPNMPIAVRGCDANGQICYPDPAKNNGQLFDSNLFKEDNQGGLIIKDFGLRSPHYNIYIQIQDKSGTDNEKYGGGNPINWQHSRIYNHTVMHVPTNDLAFTITLLENLMKSKGPGIF